MEGGKRRKKSWDLFLGQKMQLFPGLVNKSYMDAKSVEEARIVNFGEIGSPARSGWAKPHIPPVSWCQQ